MSKPLIGLLKPLIGPLLAYFTGLRFPALFTLTAVLFVVNFFIPDIIPFADEILLGLITAVLARWKKRKDPEPPSDAVG